MIASLGETAEGQIVNVNADWAANELIKTLQPYKIVFLTGTGGLLGPDGKVIDSINLSTEYEELLRQPWLHSGMRLKIEQVHNLLMALPPSSSVSITRPDQLARERSQQGSGLGAARRAGDARRFMGCARLPRSACYRVRVRRSPCPTISTHAVLRAYVSRTTAPR